MVACRQYILSYSSTVLLPLALEGTILRMLSRIAVLILALMAVVGPLHAVDAVKVAQTPQGRPLVAIVPFDFNNSRAGGLTNYLVQQLAAELSQSGRFSILDINGVLAILKQNSIRTAGILTREEVVQLGQLTRCRYVVCGVIDNADCLRSYSRGYRGTVSVSNVASVNVEYVIFDAQTGVEWKRDRGNASETAYDNTDTNYMIEKAARTTIDEFVSQLYPPIECKVVSVDENGFTIDAGTLKGVTEGVEFVIMPLDGSKAEPIIARVAENGISENTTKLIPGYWKKVRKILVKTKWQPDQSKLKDIKQGMTVQGGDKKH